MGPILHEFKHSVKSKTFVGILVLIIIITILRTSGFTVNEINPTNSSPHLDEAYYCQNSSYHIVNHVFNDFGTPLNNLKISFGVPNLQSQSITTDKGFANFTVPVNNASIE